MFDFFFFFLLKDNLRYLHLISCTIALLCSCVRMERKCVCSVTSITLSPHCCSAVIPESTNSQGRKDPSNTENMEALSDNLASQHSQELTGTVPVSVWCMVKQSLCPFSPPQSAFLRSVVKTFFRRKLVCTLI